MDNHFCVVCNNIVVDSKTMHLSNVPEYTFNFSEKTMNLNIIECPICGAVQLYNVPLSETYLANYRSIGSTENYREEKIRQLVKFIHEYYLYDKTFLEIGCGNGQYLEIFKELGIQCDGLESGKDNLIECEDKGFNVSLFKNQYDVICMFYYLEHLPYPFGVIKNIYRNTKQGGLFLVEVPNYDFIEKNNLWLEFTRDHRIYYRGRTLQYLLMRAGFEIESISNDTICLSIIARRPAETSFIKMIDQIHLDIDKFNKLVQECNSDYAIVGAGHWTQLLLNQIDVKPKYVFDSVPQKTGYKLCGILIQPQSEIINMNDCNNIIISCGIYNKEALKNLQALERKDKRYILWE
jgi:SAM-dependent methyltransferase